LQAFLQNETALNLTSLLALLKFDTLNLSVKFTANGLKFEVYTPNLPNNAEN